MRPLSIWFNAAVGILASLTSDSFCHGEHNNSFRLTGGRGTEHAYAEAERLFGQSEYEQALAICDQSLDDSFPPRIYNRIQAVAARSCVLLNRREEALRRVESIYKRDPASPFLSLVPLVWDDRLPINERYVASPADLQSESPTRQLAAASSLLLDSRHSERCVEILTDIRAERRLPMSILAETQLWRVQMPTTDTIYLPTVRRWQQRAGTLPESLRAGPQFLVGRALQLRHKPDQASLELLWLPMMRTDDPYLAAAALAESILCLEATGGSENARRLRRELQDRYGGTSGARRLTRPESDPPPGK
jgi:tetratricopeptide (TPR) repeat protein